MRRRLAGMLLAVCLLLAGCGAIFEEPLPDQWRLAALRWASHHGGRDVRIVSTAQVSANFARAHCSGVPANGLPGQLGALRLVGFFHGGETAFVIVAPDRGALYARVPAPARPCA